MENLILGVLSIIFILSIIILYRNNKVYNYRIELLDKVSEKADEDIKKGLDWETRYKKLKEVGYHEMIYKFWKPLDSFYDLEDLLK